MVLTRVVTFVPAWVTAIVAPEMTAPSWSFTVPVSVARSTWAWAGIANSTRAASSSKRFMGTSASVWVQAGIVTGASYTGRAPP